MYKIVQNYLERNEYEYKKEYQTLSEASKMIDEYYNEDRKNGEVHSYTIIDNEGEDVHEKIKNDTRAYAITAMLDLGMPYDEAENMLDDIL